MDSIRLAVLLGGTFFLAFGLAAYRYFYTVLGATAGLAVWMAVSDTLVQLPGLREHPGTAGLLILALLVLTGVFLASKFRRLLVFFSGLGTGLLLSQTFSVFMTGGALSDTAFRFGRIDAMDILVGLIGGILFLLFERVFALLLTSVVGSFLCTWAIGGGRWTFAACLLIGLVAQPLIFTRFKPPPPAAAGKDRTGSTTLMVFLLLWLLPAQAAASWVVERVHPLTSRVVIGAGWRDGVKENENYAVIDNRGSLIAVISVGEVFSTSSYSVAISPEKLTQVIPGMGIVIMEEFEFTQAMKLGGESRFEEFLKKYPDSENRKAVIEALDESRYRLAELTGTVDAFRQFQKKYPTSRYGAKARKKEEELLFKKAWDEGTEEAFRDFLSSFKGTTLVTGISEVRAFLKARQIGKVYAYQDFLAAYPGGKLAGEFVPYIDEFELWAEKLEFGRDPVEAIRHFGELGDETAIPFLVGKLNLEALESEARNAIHMIGVPALGTLMEVLISPLQSIDLKDKVAVIIGQIGEISTIPAIRTYVDKEKTPAGRKALLMLEDKAGR
ncbi:MAG: hypothetical protein RRA15_07455 [bacterium]|nr:hypothetical protein [bacterium]MDT8366312.1 hypothetical protein [bacterium]